MRINALYVIIKLVERCNLKCSYCYYYTPENAEVYQRPTLMPDACLDNLIGYVQQALLQAPVRRVVFGFHGGEPTLAKAAKVRSFCTAARERLQPHVDVDFTLQTNGVHLSEDWLQLISEQGMGVGISIDGDRALHDRYRIDHQDRGSYDRVCANLHKLQSLDPARPIRLTALAVMGEGFEGLAHYRHLVEDLGIRRIKFLFVDNTADSPLAKPELEKLSQELCEVFDHWLLHDRNRVRVTLFDTAVRGLLASHYDRRGTRDRVTMGFALLSDGRIRIQDDFMIASDWFWSQTELNVRTSAFTDYLHQPHLQQLLHELSHVPKACQDCRFAESCAGGEPAHRYSRDRSFDNRSVYCEALYRFYSHVEARLGAGSRILSERNELPAMTTSAA